MKCPYRISESLKVQNSQYWGAENSYHQYYEDCYLEDCPYYTIVKNEDGSERGMCNRVIYELTTGLTIDDEGEEDEYDTDD